MVRGSSTYVSSFPLHINTIIIIILLASSSSSISIIPFTLSLQWNDGDLIEQICKKTPFYDLCSSTLHSNPLSPKTDTKGVALIMVNNILANASDTLSYIEGLIKETKDPQMEQALAFCAESYIPLVRYTLPQAADAIIQGRFGFASYCISDTLKEVNSCDKRFSGSPESPLGDRNGIVQKLVDVASAIIKLLLKG